MASEIIFPASMLGLITGYLFYEFESRILCIFLFLFCKETGNVVKF
jgi:hypothetical protein